VIEAFVSKKVLGRGKATSLVLVHGLFANSAFWLPYLPMFRDCEVVLINIDYVGLFRSEFTVEQMAHHLDSTLDVGGAHLIGHSFGACVGLNMCSRFASRSFICPTFVSTRFDCGRFCDEIAELAALPDSTVRPVVDYAVDFKSTQSPGRYNRSLDELYLPLDDPYFDYPDEVEGVVSQRFLGGHFDLRQPLDMILARYLASQSI
jgi:pimeloyl-ACP methyl ester carboxylesterase